MRYHSGLEAKDGIILGASSVKHLEENLTDLEKGPLPESVVEAFDQAWDHVKPVSTNYFVQAKDRRYDFVKNVNKD